MKLRRPSWTGAEKCHANAETTSILRTISIQRKCTDNARCGVHRGIVKFIDYVDAKVISLE